MSAFRLQTFAPSNVSAPRKALEAKRDLTAAREEAYRAGYQAGHAAATEDFLHDSARLSSDLIEALNDAALSNEAARRHVAASLTPMVEALFAALAPSLAELGVIEEVGRLVDEALRTAPNARPRLRCAPELSGTIRRVLADRGLEARIEDAPELLPREAQLFWDQGYDHLDLDACIAQIRDCLASHLHQNAESEEHAAIRHG